jgi:hypothetical protein
MANWKQLRKIWQRLPLQNLCRYIGEFAPEVSDSSARASKASRQGRKHNL